MPETLVRVSEAKVTPSEGMIYFGLPVLKDDYQIKIVVAHDNGTNEARQDPAIALRFSDLSEWWHADMDAKSVDHDKFDHPAYKRILDMGEDVIPCILADLRDRSGHWFVALRQLSKDDSIDANANGSMRRARDAWLKWGKSKRLI